MSETNAREARHSSKSNEWYTPKKYIEAAREVMGWIDLDPASCWAANAIVDADVILTPEQDGLTYTWCGRVWLNPPYGLTGRVSNQSLWSKKLINGFRAGTVTQAVLLVNAETSAGWFQELWDYPICFTNHRIRFISGETGEPQSSPTHGNAFVYFGEQRQKFARVFREFGFVVKRHDE